MQGQCPEADVAVLSGNKHITSMLRMKADRRFPMTIGGVDCRLIKYKVGNIVCTHQSVGKEWLSWHK